MPVKRRISPLGSLAANGRCGLSVASGNAITTAGDLDQTSCIFPSFSTVTGCLHDCPTRRDLWLTGRFQQRPGMKNPADLKITLTAALLFRRRAITILTISTGLTIRAMCVASSSHDPVNTDIVETPGLRLSSGAGRAAASIPSPREPRCRAGIGVPQELSRWMPDRGNGGLPGRPLPPARDRNRSAVRASCAPPRREASQPGERA